MKKKIAFTFMTVGTLLVCFALGLFIYNNLENKKAKENSDAVMVALRSVVSETALADIETDPFDKEMTVKEIDGYGYIGYISIPALDLDLPVMADCDYGRLKISPCRYYGSTKTDNLVIAAHNYKYHFGYLGSLEIGDTVMFTDMAAETRYYTITSVEMLTPADVDKVKDTGDDLILYTCTYGGSKRITVRCSYTK